MMTRQNTQFVDKLTKTNRYTHMSTNNILLRNWLFDTRKRILESKDTSIENPESKNIKVILDQELSRSIWVLKNGNYWYDRKMAARKIGAIGGSWGISSLCEALKEEKFWIVRCEIIIILNKVGNSEVIPVLKIIEQYDRFPIVRQYASKVIEGFSARN